MKNAKDCSISMKHDGELTSAMIEGMVGKIVKNCRMFERAIFLGDLALKGKKSSKSKCEEEGDFGTILTPDERFPRLADEDVAGDWVPEGSETVSL